MGPTRGISALSCGALARSRFVTRGLRLQAERLKCLEYQRGLQGCLPLGRTLAIEGPLETVKGRCGDGEDSQDGRRGVSHAAVDPSGGLMSVPMQH